MNNTQVSEILEVLNNFAPYILQESYDNSGLLVGQKNGLVEGVLTTLDCTEEVLHEAIEKKCNVIIAHHPIIFKGLKKITDQSHVERIVYKAIQHNIHLISYHTNLDNVTHGVNHKIANKLSLINTQILKPLSHKTLKKLCIFCPVSHAEIIRNALFLAGAGNIGNYNSCSYNSTGYGTFKALENANPYVGEVEKLHQEEEIKIEVIFPEWIEPNIIQAVYKNHPYEEPAFDIISLDNTLTQYGSGIIGELSEKTETVQFLQNVKTTFKTGCIKHSPIIKNTIKRIAVCGGSGYFLLPDAIRQGADIFITSDIKYHDFFNAEEKIVLADIGHYESEQFTKELIKDIISQKFSNFAIHVSNVNTNSVKYLI